MNICRCDVIDTSIADIDTQRGKKAWRVTDLYSEEIESRVAKFKRLSNTDMHIETLKHFIIISVYIKNMTTDV